MADSVRVEALPCAEAAEKIQYGGFAAPGTSGKSNPFQMLSPESIPAQGNSAPANRLVKMKNASSYSMTRVGEKTAEP